jgi:hypothetical protein
MRMLALIAVAAVLAAAPAATTGPAEEVTTTSATATGTIDPNGLATTYHVEYGTSSAYGLVTRDRNAGAGNEPLGVRVALSGLTPDTDYHYRLVAENGDGVATGSDATLRTQPRPRPPGAATGKPRPVGATATTLRGTVVPNGLQTEYHFEYGTTLEYGARTPGGSVGPSDGLVRPSEPIAGLRPNTRYHVRMVATNAAGRTVGVDRTFLTLRQPTSVSITVEPARLVWGRAVVVTGRVSGEGIEHIPVALERLDFPFTTGYAQFGSSATAGLDGGFSFKIPAVYSTTQVRVITRTRVVAVSAPATVTAKLKVGLRTRRLRHGRIRLTGAVWPAAPHGRASLQRQGRRGRWTPLTAARLTPPRLNRSRYRFNLRPPRRTRTYRVVVIARDGGAHAPGTSRSRSLSRRG